MLDAVEGSKKTTLPRFINALGIKHVGEATARALAEHFGSLEKLQAASAEEIEETQDVGPTVAESIRKFLDDSRNVKLIRQLLDAGITFKAPERAGDGLAGQVIVFTGGFESMSRDEAKALAQSHGAKTSDSVSKTVPLVVAGPGAGSKLEKATKLGIKVLDEGAFLKLIGR
jgi:DNA ligase (NAD+)